MSNTTLNDIEYSFKPLEVYVTPEDYQVDEVELQKSKNKSKEIFARLKEKKQKAIN